MSMDWDAKPGSWVAGKCSTDPGVPQDLLKHVLFGVDPSAPLEFVSEPVEMHLYNISVDAPAGWGERIYRALEDLACESVTVSDDGISEIR